MIRSIEEASAILQPPFVFGSNEQIAAATFIEQVEECVLAIVECDDPVFETVCQDCSGEGRRACSYGCEHVCAHCDGTGKGAELNESISRFHRHIVEEALKSERIDIELAEIVEGALDHILVDPDAEVEEPEPLAAGGGCAT